MSLLEKMKGIKEKAEAGPSKDAVQTTKNWYNDRYEWMTVQRNALFLIIVISIVTIGILSFGISFIKSTRSIEPFVIEIEQKTGVPTVVEPLTVKAFSANEAIKRYFVWKYIKAREEYFYTTFDKKYFTTLPVMSSDDVYGQYRRQFSKGNPQSPWNLYGQNSYRTVELKSMIFQDERTVQVRLVQNIQGIQTGKLNKIVFMEFDFENLEMNDEQRFINPLGFVVKLYRIEDERL